jgi:acyl dehydratase
MPVRGDALGAELEPRTVEVTARMTLAFAAGIGDLGPRTFDDAGPDPLVASPSFCVRLEWAVLGRSRASALGLEEAERLRAVHVEQDSSFHRAIRPGDALTTRARIVAIRATSVGALVQTRLSTVDSASDAAVVTSWHSAIYRDVALAGASGRVEDPPALPAPPASLAGQATLHVPREAAHVYGECADIWNPIHSERRVALNVGLPDIVLHGTAAWAMAGRKMVEAYAAGDPTRLRRLRARFQAPIVPGGDILLAHGPGDAGQAHFRVGNTRAETALADGYLEWSR